MLDTRNNPMMVMATLPATSRSDPAVLRLIQPPLADYRWRRCAPNVKLEADPWSIKGPHALNDHRRRKTQARRGNASRQPGQHRLVSATVAPRPRIW
jgi:hypothetical protein